MLIVSVTRGGGIIPGFIILFITPLSVPFIGLVSCSTIMENETSPHVLLSHVTILQASSVINKATGTNKPNGMIILSIFCSDPSSSEVQPHEIIANSKPA